MRVNFTAFVNDCSGFGQAARRLVTAMNAAGIDVRKGAVLTDGGPCVEPSEEVRVFLSGEPHVAPDVHLIHAAASDLPRLVGGPGRQVGSICWETSKLHPLAEEGLKAVDQVLVPSKHNQDVCAQHGIAASVVPYPAVWRYVDSKILLQDLPDDVLIFYSILTWQERKHPLGLLTAYLTAFTAEDDVLLVLKVSGTPGVAQMAYKRLLRALYGDPTQREDLGMPEPPAVRFLDTPMTDDAIWALHAAGDCYVSLARGEAFGLPLLDAAVSGNPVIATEYGGHLDFLSLHGGNYWPIPARLTPVAQDYPHFDGSQNWADPDILAAQAAMRDIHRKSQNSPQEPIQEALSLTDVMSPEVIGLRLLEVLSGGD